MAQITYANKVALNDNPNINAINKVRDVDMNELKEVINENETKILLAVTDTEPAECSTGDMYYNTTDDLIYTATATDTWSSTGVAPTENTMYVVYSTQTAYAYDGNTLISVGGGGSSITVHNSYSASTTEPYSANYVNGAISGAIVSTYTNNQTSAYSTEYINDVLGYSSSETFTGKYWINNKPIYRMVITITDTNATTNWKNYNYSDLGIPSGMEWARFPEAYTTIVQSGNTFWESFYSNGTRIQTSPADNKINILGNGASYASYVLVMEYTKSN